MRTANPYTLIDLVTHYGIDTNIVKGSGSGAGITTGSIPDGVIKLYTTTAAGDSAILRTRTWVRYQAGRGQQIIQTLYHDNTGSYGQERNWGYFDNGDGLYWQLTGSQLNVVRRNSSLGEGGIQEVVPQQSWSFDKFDGTGPSGKVLDITKGNIYEMRFQWLGVGDATFWIDGDKAHTFLNHNRYSYPYMRKASLPLTWEVKNNVATAATGTMNIVCANVTSVGGQHPPEYGYAISRATPKSVGVTEIPIIAIRTKSLFNGEDNRSLLIPHKFSATTDAGKIIVRVYKDVVTLGGASWVSVNPSSKAEYDVSATTFAGGILLYEAYLVNNIDYGEFDLSHIFELNGRVLRKDPFEDFSDILLVTATKAAASTTNVDSSLFWTEVY
jgi:hypothetical protein